MPTRGSRDTVTGMKVLAWLSALLLCASSLWSLDGSSFTAFFPNGTEASMTGPQGTSILVSGQTVPAEAGTYTILLRHPDFEPLARTLRLETGQELVLLPRLTPSSAYRKGQRATLEEQQTRARADRDGVLMAAGVTGISALASWGMVAALEWTLAQKKTKLASAQADYRAASSSEAPGLWAGIESLKADIASFRSYETYAAATAGVLTAGGLALLFLGPDPRDWDEAIRMVAGKPSE